MQGFHGNLSEMTIANTSFRKVLYTAKHTQLVLMSIPVGGEIGEEVHEHNDQFIRIEAGEAKAIIDDNEYQLAAGSAIVVPTGAKHNVINTSTSESLQLYTLYSPPHHQDGVERATRAEAEASEPEFDGKTTE